MTNQQDTQQLRALYEQLTQSIHGTTTNLWSRVAQIRSLPLKLSCQGLSNQYSQGQRLKPMLGPYMGSLEQVDLLWKLMFFCLNCI